MVYLTLKISVLSSWNIWYKQHSVCKVIRRLLEFSYCIYVHLPWRLLDVSARNINKSKITLVSFDTQPKKWYARHANTFSSFEFRFSLHSIESLPLFAGEEREKEKGDIVSDSSVHTVDSVRRTLAHWLENICKQGSSKYIQ